MPLNCRVRSLNCETNWPRLMPNLPSDVPTGGAGVACPPGTWNFAWPVTVFAFAIFCQLSVVSCQLQICLYDGPLTAYCHLHRLNLPMFDLDRRRAAENVDHHLHAAVGLVDRVYVAFEILEIAFLDANAVARLERNGRLDPRALLFGQNLAGTQNPLDIPRLHRRRLAGGAREVADA